MYFALGAAVLTYLLTRDIRSTISVVIVAGACGIAAGTPLAILGAIGRAARAGAIIKGGLFLEQLGQVDTVVLDKTGTLTYGQPEVRTLVPVDGQWMSLHCWMRRLPPSFDRSIRWARRLSPMPERWDALPRSRNSSATPQAAVSMPSWTARSCLGRQSGSHA